MNFIIQLFTEFDKIFYLCYNFTIGEEMAKKTVNVEIEIDEKIMKFVELVAALKKVQVKTFYKELIDLGINKGAKNVSEAVNFGLLEFKSEIDKVCGFIKLQAIVDKPFKPANEVEEALMKNALLAKDDEIIKQIKEKHFKGAKQ